jgi:hypothetical protein
MYRVTKQGLVPIGDNATLASKPVAKRPRHPAVSKPSAKVTKAAAALKQSITEAKAGIAQLTRAAGRQDLLKATGKKGLQAQMAALARGPRKGLQVRFGGAFNTFGKKRRRAAV